MSRIRIGVIGLHFGATVHVPAFRTDSRCVVAALASRDRGRTAAVAAELGIAVSHPDWRTLLRDEAIDAVSVAVPPHAQAEIVIEAARAGKHVFCEKPLAASLASAERALECARRAGIVHAIDFIFPELPAWQQARTLLRDGAIGRPRHFAYSWQLQTFASRTRADSWKNRVAEGGGAVGNFLSHVIFNLEWLLGDITRIDSLPRRNVPAASSFCDCVAYLGDDLHGSISIATDAYLGTGHHVEIFGDSGTLVLSNPTRDYADGFELRLGTVAAGGLQLVGDHRSRSEGDGRIAPVGRIVHRFIDAIKGAGDVRPNLDDGIRVQRWLQRIADDDAR